MDNNRLEQLLCNYREQAKPLMDDIYARIGKYPDNCLNEIRAMLDHVSRCYKAVEINDNQKHESISDVELSRAESHLRRLMYDCFKQLDVLLYDAIHHKERSTFSSRWLFIDGGAFWRDYSEELCRAKYSVVLAKKNESYQPDIAMKNYDNSYNSYCKIEQLLVSHKRSLFLSKCVKWFEFIDNWGCWLGVTIILSIISAIICAIIG